MFPNCSAICRILSPDKTEWRLISATLRGWWRRFVADQFVHEVQHKTNKNNKSKRNTLGHSGNILMFVIMMCKLWFIIFTLLTSSVIAGFSRHGMPPPTSNRDFWPFDLETGVRVTSKVGNLFSKFGYARPLGSRIIRCVHDRWPDKSNAYRSLPYSRGIINHLYPHHWNIIIQAYSYMGRHGKNIWGPNHGFGAL